MTDVSTTGLAYLDPSGETPCESPPPWFEKALQLDKDGSIRGLGTKPIAAGAFGKIFLLDAGVEGAATPGPTRSVSEMSASSSHQQKSHDSAAEAIRRILSDLPLLNRPKLGLRRKAILKQMIKTGANLENSAKKNAALRREGYMLHLVSVNEMEYRNKFGTALNPLLHGCFETEQHIYILMEAGPVSTLADVELIKGIAERREEATATEDDLLKETEKHISSILVKTLLALRRHLFTVDNKMRKCIIVHRDVKLANILFDADTKDLMLVDWGSAATLTTPALALKEIEGTRAYMAPEVLASEGVYFKELIEEHPEVKDHIPPTLEFWSLETCNSAYNFQCDVWSVAVTVFLLQYGRQTQDFSPFAPPEWDMDCAEDWETYSNKELLRCMLDTSCALKNAPECSGKRFETAEKTSLLPALLRQMLRPNTETFQFVKPDYKAGDRGVTAEYRLTLDEVLSQPFCKLAEDNGLLELDICNELDVAVPARRATCAIVTSGSSMPEESTGDHPIEISLSLSLSVPDGIAAAERQPSESTRGVKRPHSSGNDANGAESEEEEEEKETQRISCFSRFCRGMGAKVVPASPKSAK